MAEFGGGWGGGAVKTHSLAIVAMFGGLACQAEDRIAADVPDVAEDVRPSAHVMTSGMRSGDIASAIVDTLESYAPQATEGGARMRNEAQRFLATLNRNELTVVSDRGGWHLGMRTVAVGCKDSMFPVENARQYVSGNRVELHRPGIYEWYMNGHAGIEHGFVIAQAPHCNGSKVIAIEVHTDLPAARRENKRHGHVEGIEWVDDSGQVTFAYSNLFVKDATGRLLPSCLSLDAGTVTITLDDTEAVYPLVVDPLIWAHQAKLLAIDGAPGDSFGISVSLSGDTAIIGARSRADNGEDSGAAYVFVRDGATWIQEAKLLPSGGESGDYFGQSVSLSGDTALVGAHMDDDMGPDAGAAYVFVRNGTTWTQQAKLVGNTPTAYTYFGQSLSLSGDTALIGNSGAQHIAHVFVREGTSWVEQATLKTNAGGLNDFFGSTVSLSGNSALVGAHGDGANNTGLGAAYIFVRNGTTWIEQAKLIASDGNPQDQLSDTVSLNGDTALLGALSHDEGVTDSGAAYVFVRNGTTWTQQQKLLPKDKAKYDRFGFSLAVTGDTAIVSTQHESAYLFTRSGTVWTEQNKLTASDGLPDQFFGTAVALSENTAIIGACYDDDLGALSGSAHVFALSKANGDACITATECASSFCVDGVCCNSSCGNGDTNDCQACSVAAGTLTSGTCTPLGVGRQCRPSKGNCDIAEACDGFAIECPVDKLAAGGVECRAPVHLCDAPEICDGSAPECPVDANMPDGTVCAAGTCFGGVCSGEGASGDSSNGSSGPYGNGDCGCRMTATSPLPSPIPLLCVLGLACFVQRRRCAILHPASKSPHTKPSFRRSKASCRNVLLDRK